MVIFKIMGEFVNGYEQMSAVGPCVSIFGSARTKAGTPHYALGVDVAKAIAEKGYGIITGGGPGIMEAGNKGAQAGKGNSIGLNIDLPFEQSSNRISTLNTILIFNTSLCVKSCLSNILRRLSCFLAVWGR